MAASRIAYYYYYVAKCRECRLSEIGELCLRERSKTQETQLSLTNLHDAFIGQSRSPNIVPFHHMLGIASYCAIVTFSLTLAVFTIFDFKNVVTLKYGSEVTQGH